MLYRLLPDSVNRWQAILVLVRRVKAIHQPHLENFFDGMRKGAELNCTGESAFATAVTVLKVNEAIAAQKMLSFAPTDFIA